MSNFDFSDFAPDQEENYAVDLATITADAQAMLDYQKHKEDLEQQIKEIDAAIRHIAEKRIPYALSELGLSKLTLADGSVLSIDEGVTASQLDSTKPYFEFAKSFLIEHDASDLLKTKVEMEFGRGSHNEALSIVADLKDQGYDATVKETVHASTFKSFGNELLRDYGRKLENGEDADPPPFEQLGMFHYKKAKIKVGKK